MKLQNTFFVTLGATLLTSFVVVAMIFYQGALQQAEHEAMREARMLLASATAARSYNSDLVIPKLQATMGEDFFAESVPSFAAQSVIKRLNETFPEYIYRETALVPTNLNDLPKSWEIDVIQDFRGEAGLKELSGTRVEKGKEVLYIAQPIRITDEACLACHGSPKDAPPAMLAAYGQNGFGWKMGEVVGAKFVTVPKWERLSLALSNVFWFLIALGCVLLVALLVVMIVVQRAVAGPIQRLAERADQLSAGNPAVSELSAGGVSEFRSLAKAINRLHRSVALLLGDAEGLAPPDLKQTRREVGP